MTTLFWSLDWKMPYKSQAQAAYFNIHRKKLEAEGVDVGEWNRASRGKKLPKRAKKKHENHGIPGTL